MKAKKIILWSLVVGIIGLPLCVVSYAVVNSARGFLDPMGSLRIAREYGTMENDDLLKKVKGFHLQLDEQAVVVLTQRKDERIIDTMIKMLNSRFERNRMIALRSLSNYEDERIIEPIMRYVIKKQQSDYKEFDYGYMLALNILSEFHYEPAWPFVLEFARAENAPENSTNRMLKNFGKPEGAELLKKLKTAETASKRPLEN